MILVIVLCWIIHQLDITDIYLTIQFNSHEMQHRTYDRLLCGKCVVISEEEKYG
jgi:hypothetical protein